MVRQRGVALMMTIWVLVLLGIMAAQFAYSMRLEMEVARNYKDEVQLYYLSLAALELAVAEILSPYTATTLSANGEVIFVRDQSDLPGGETDENYYYDMWGQLGGDSAEFINSISHFIGHRSQFKLNNGILSYTITDEDGKFNINSLVVRNNERADNIEIFRKLLVAIGVEDGMPADIIVDSLLDWLDDDDLHHGNGAEEDYYEQNYAEQGMTGPYTPKNGPLSTVEELLMVRGMTPEILFGSSAVPGLPGQEGNDEQTFQGLYPHITVFTPASGGTRGINNNTASDLLLSLIYPDNVEDVVGRRRENGIVASRKASRYFTVQATAYLPHSDVSRTIKAVFVKATPNRASRLTVRYWKDNARYVDPGKNIFLDFVEGGFIIPTR
ncbi:general secretion pathway protein GspK [bacterium]|nr:general secretion pathway protein GspK [candidate division CSSED10-310 bacterium]